jgi:Tol biopolymer transport system component
MPEGTDIWFFELSAEGDTLRGSQPRNFTSRPGYDNQPHFVVGGSLLYVQQEGERTDLWRWSPETNLKTRLTLTPDASEYSPTPIPGGEGAISYVKVEPDSTQRLWRMEGDGEGADVLVPDIAPVGYHAWIDDTRVALYVLGDPAALRIVDVQSGNARTVAEGIGRSPQPVPDRPAVSFTRPDDGGVAVEIYDADADETERVVRLPEGAAFHAWTPDGTLLTAVESRILARQGDRWVEVAELTALGQEFSRLAVSPDGARLAVVAEPAGS